MTTEHFWTGLVDDAATFPPGHADLAPAVRAYAERSGEEAELVGAFVVRDTDLPVLPAGFAGPVSVVVTGGAGQLAGPAALCGKRGITLAGLDVALRDLDDPAGNARRVVAAVDAARAEGVLDPDVPVHVELPQAEASYSWLAAADEVAGAELRLKLRTGGLEPHQHPSAALLASWIDAALDRETPFRCTAGLHRALRHTAEDGAERHGFVNVLAATRRAFEGASRGEVVATLEERTLEPDAGELVAGRRWFTSFGSCSVDEPMADIRALDNRVSGLL